MTREEAIRALWFEYKVAKQYTSTFSSVEDGLIVASGKRAVAYLDRDPEDDSADFPAYTEDGFISNTPYTNGSHWVEADVDPPAWFLREELGIGTDLDVFHIMETLEEDNYRRRQQYEESRKKKKK